MRVHSWSIVVVIGSIVFAATANSLAPSTRAYGQVVGREVPFGDKVGPAVTKYNRLRPGIATAGALKDDAINELKSLGFATILNLCSPEEGADVEKRSVEAAGLRYFNIPLTEIIPSDDQITEFARIVEDATYFPLLIHCKTANRTGAMWTFYRARRGIPISIAVEEGRTIGMQQDREDAVLNHLGRPTRRD